MPSKKLVEELVQRTRDDLVGDAWLVWATAQRASLPLKIEACVAWVIFAVHNTLAFLTSIFCGGQ